MENLAPGFLIAMPQLGDPSFHRSVVLMVEHSGTGSMGLVLNRPTRMTLAELAKGQSISVAPGRSQDRLYLGGPVEPQRGFVLHDSGLPVDRQEVMPGVFLTVAADALEPLLNDAGCHLRFCLGYSGWGAGQLDRELAAGSWLFSEAGASAVLSSDPEKLWEDTLRAMGVDPAMLQVGRGVH